MVNTSIPIVALLVIMVGMSAWYASFYGDDVVEDKFANIQEPTNFFTTLEFLTDTGVAVGQTLWSFLVFSGSDLPDGIAIPLRAIMGILFALLIIAALAAFL